MSQADVDGILATTRRGTASGRRNNCLIDSSRQLLQPAAQVAPFDEPCSYSFELELQKSLQAITCSLIFMLRPLCDSLDLTQP